MTSQSKQRVGLGNASLHDDSYKSLSNSAGSNHPNRSHTCPLKPLPFHYLKNKNKNRIFFSTLFYNFFFKILKYNYVKIYIYIYFQKNLLKII
jgi:hypothetical protein